MSEAFEFELTPEVILECRKLLKVNEAAFVLNLTGRKIRYLIHDGVFRCSRTGPLRIPVADVKKYLRRKAA